MNENMKSAASTLKGTARLKQEFGLIITGQGKKDGTRSEWRVELFMTTSPGEISTKGAPRLAAYGTTGLMGFHSAQASMVLELREFCNALGLNFQTAEYVVHNLAENQAVCRAKFHNPYLPVE